MTPLEAEAMLIRYQAAIKWLETCDEQGRWELLGAVVAPGEAALSASLTVAKRRGVSTLARKLVSTHKETLRRPSRVAVNNTAPKRHEWLRA